jgi:hypothetical protein
VIEHLFSHIVARKIERRVDDWVAAGQTTDAMLAPDGTACHQAFGFRYRLQNLLVCFVFGTVFFVFSWYHFTAQRAEFWLVVAYIGFVFPVFLLSAILALGACTTRVTLSTEGIGVRCFGIDSTRVNWSQISEVYRSSVTPAIVLMTNDRRRIRISTQLNGVRALAEYLQHVRPGVVHRSVVDWMINLP